MTHKALQPDWDGFFTLTLTFAVVLTTLGLAYLVSLRRVIAIARSPTSDHRGQHDWLVVPGKRLIANRPDADFRHRLDRAQSLARHPFAGRLAILGGKTAHANVSEAEAGADYLRTRGLNPGAEMTLEDQSLNTLTNLRNLRDLIGHVSDTQPLLVIISNRYHLARLGIMASSLGLSHRLEPAEPRLIAQPGTLVHLAREGLFCLWFRVGKGWAAMTGNERMLARVT